jgi:plasmid stability protein
MQLWQYGDMAKVKTTLSLDEQLMRHIRVRAARTGKTQSDVLEQALREGLGVIDRIRSRNEADESEALKIASQTVHEIRSEGRTS